MAVSRIARYLCVSELLVVKAKIFCDFGAVYKCHQFLQDVKTSDIYLFIYLFQPLQLFHK